MQAVLDSLIEPVDIVIPTRGRGALIEVAITSILESSYPHFTLWVIDQSNDDATEQAVARCTRDDPRVRYERIHAHGASLARNHGARLGAAPHIVNTDDDCRVERDWLAALVAELHAPETWAAFGRVVPDDGHRSSGHGFDIDPAIALALKNERQRRVYQGSRLNLGFGHGANVGIRRERFEQFGGYDELLGAGGPLRSWEERDLGYRMLAHGGRIVYTPEATVYHRHWRPWEQVRRTYRDYAIGAGAACGKYIRCGDLGGWYLLIEWILDQGMRQIASGALKWQSWQKMQIGWLQMVYPWVGLLRGRTYPVDRQRLLYRRA